MAIAAPRAIAFVDGQNLYHAARQAFDYSHPNYDVKALAARVSQMGGWELTQTRFYTGIPSHKENPFWHGFWVSKLAGMWRQGVEVYSLPVRYRNQRTTLADGREHVVRVGEEKGIDVRIAVDVICMAFRRSYDVAIIFSQDQDLAEVAKEVRLIAKTQSRWIKVACAYPVGPGTRYSRGIDRTDWIQIDRATYSACLDPNDHRT